MVSTRICSWYDYSKIYFLRVLIIIRKRPFRIEIYFLHVFDYYSRASISNRDVFEKQRETGRLSRTDRDCCSTAPGGGDDVKA